MYFGKKLKELRIREPYASMRDVAKALDMKPSEYSRLEHAYAAPPEDAEWFWKLVYSIGVGDDIEAQLTLRSLLLEPFVMQEMPEFIPAFVCTTDGNPLSKDKMTEFVEWMNDKVEEHNKEAKEYNEQ
jgi:hypothetical protein